MSETGSQTGGEAELPLEEWTDQSLLRQFRAGSDDAATALYVRYAQRLEHLAVSRVDRKAAVRVDPEGIVQSVFRTFFRRVSGGQYDVGDREDLWKLLLVIALNKLRSEGAFHRAAKRSVTRTEVLQDDVEQRSGAAGEPLSLTVLRMTVDELLGELPDDHRAIVGLRIEGYEVAEIATRTGRAKRSVERVLQAFRKRLQTTLGDGSGT